MTENMCSVIYSYCAFPYSCFEISEAFSLQPYDQSSDLLLSFFFGCSIR
ncbi:unnamed protein product [Brassica rapa subsp. trilocularis]